jgi:ribonuclease HI
MTQYCAYVDGGCPSNGKNANMMFGSFIIYDLKDCSLNINDQNFHAALTFEQEPIIKKLRFNLTVSQCIPKEVEYAAKKITNNTAETLSFLCLLIELKNNLILHKDNFVTVFMDSELVIKQVTGLYGVKQPHLKRIHQYISKLISEIKMQFKCDITDLMHLQWISGEVMKQTVIGH